MIPDLLKGPASPFALGTGTRKNSKETMAAMAEAPVEQAVAAGPSKGIGSVINGLFESLTGGEGGGSGGAGLNYLGEFNVDSFIESTLAKSKGGGGGGGIAELLGSLLSGGAA